MDINLNLYKSFYNVIKYGSFTKAAEKLNVSQPGLSYNIKKLEDELGYKLLDRTKGGVSLTSVGKKVYINLITVFNTLDNILEIKNNDVVKIRLAARVGLATRKLINIVRDFNKLNSEVSKYCQSFNLPVNTASSFYLEKIGVDNFIRRLDNNSKFLRISSSFIKKEQAIEISEKVAEYLNKIM